MNIASRIYDYRQTNSLAASLRNKRLNWFRSLLETVPTPINILDVGGRASFWNNLGLLDSEIVGWEITLLNQSEQETLLWDGDSSNPSQSKFKFKSCLGDARDMSQFANQQFDIVFSNSVIEHVGDYQDKQRMAQEVQRVGKRYFIQTPNFHFPIEPHFVFPAFHWLPIPARVWLITHFSLGWFNKYDDPQCAEADIRGIQLLRKDEFLNLFPDAQLFEEKLLGLTKSFIAFGGWECPDQTSSSLEKTQLVSRV
ncbi:MAG: methyltransferase domain-containing protein [Synechococcales bacterium]|nr:methyltransferase domain-containing protein [Synechococcales bacterium]